MSQKQPVYDAENAQADEEVMIKLLSSDNVMFTLPKKAAILSDLIADIINIDSDSCHESSINNDDTVSSSSTSTPQKQNEGYKLERVVSTTLEKVVAFLIYYNKNPMQPIPDVLQNTFIRNVPQDWYRTFCASENMDLPLLFAIREAANYLLIKPLVNLTNVRLTFQVIGKSTTEIHELLNIPRMTNDQEVAARQSHSWAFQPLEGVEDL